MTRRLLIKERNRSHPIWLVRPGDFTVEMGDEIAPESVLEDPAFTLYCFNPDNTSALFVECDDPVAVDSAPFYYQAQAEHAISLVSMPMDTFHQMANNIAMPKKGLIFIHSVGRCGSTLLSKALAAVPSVHSLSEPDDLTQMVTLRSAGVIDESQLQGMLKSSIRWRCKKRQGPAFEFVAIKPRSEVMVMAEHFANLYPDAKHIFLYRNAITWMQSYFAGFPHDRDLYNAEENLKMEEGWTSMLPIFKEYRKEGSPMNPVQIRVLGWITSMEGYFTLQEQGVNPLAVRFEELTARPLEKLHKIFEYCGIEKVDWKTIEDVLGRDSQAGTFFAQEERRKNPRILTEELIQDVRDMVATRPRLRVPEVELPSAG